MSALSITQTVTDDGRPVYSFVSRKVEYTVFDRQDGSFEVWSNRQGCSFAPQVAVMTAAEMSARTKTLKQLVTLIQVKETA
jgi:hypothetical protein